MVVVLWLLSTQVALNSAGSSIRRYHPERTPRYQSARSWCGFLPCRRSWRDSAESGPDDLAMPLYNLPFSPIVRVDYPAFQNGETPLLGSAPAPRFRKPLTLIVPHCFDDREGQEMIAMLGGAPHGAASWEPLARGDLSSSTRDEVVLHGTEMRVNIPYAGTFCAFAKNTRR